MVEIILSYIYIVGINSLASGCFRGFSGKNRLNARGFAREFLQSDMLYRPSKSLKRRDKSSKKLQLDRINGEVL